MRDSEQQYPFHQPGRNDGRRHPFDEDISAPVDATPDLEEEQPRQYGAPMRQRARATTPQLPRGGLLNTLIIGAIVGVLCEAQSILIIYLNASTFDTVSRLKDKTPYPVALTALGINVLTFFIGLLLIFIGGFFVGRIAVQRRLGFVAGFIAGLVTYAITFILNYIPSFPGHYASSGSVNAGGVTGGIIATLIALLIWGVIGGLASLLGTWLATRHHPYYVGYSG